MLKLFLMTKNESELLEDWIKFHGYQFGLDNIHVLDGSDDQNVLEIYKKYQKFGLNVHFSSTGLDGLAKELTDLMHEFKGSNNFLIKLDTDEFLVAVRPNIPIRQNVTVAGEQPPHIGDLNKLYGPSVKSLTIGAEGGFKLEVNSVNDLLRELPITGQKYKASFVSWSLPRQGSVESICRTITQFTSPQYSQIKSFFHSSSFISVDLGSHVGVSSQNEGHLDTALSILHYHSTSVSDSVRRARQVLLSHEYIVEADTVSEQWEKLEKIRRIGSVSSYHKIDLYMEYLKAMEEGKGIDVDLLNKQHPLYQPSSSSVNLDLVRDTLEEIDQQQLFS